MFIERAREGITELEGSERGGVIGGYSPIHSHVQLYLVQICFIVILCSILGQVVKKWNQPRVIAEVMAGVLLGPSAFGAIPGFTTTIFPEESMEPLTLTAHLGLILFLFIVGLELDPALLQSNVKKASILSLVGQGVTWVLSLGVSRAMITWMDDVEASTSFVLFIGVSLSVTAFPVLSRILGENSLLNTNVGALVISAASVDEACVWCLLALVVSTVNAGSPLDAFYVFLLLMFFVIVMITAVRWALLRIVRRISDDDTGAPSRGVVILCLLLTLLSAWVTDFIGIDAIFGAFIAGIIVPREHSLHVRIVELVQDVVSVLLLPLYFAVSGLKTDLTLLDNATSWGICALTILAACLGKIGGAAAVARVFGMTKRESLAVGVLMNTRGLVELIILNIGLDAGVLTEEVMAIMVLMALVTTFMTAPLSALVYPPKYHSQPGRKRRRRASGESRAANGHLLRPLNSIPNLGEFARDRLSLMVLLTNPAGLDAVARIARLFSGNRQAEKDTRVRRKHGGKAGSDDGDGELVVHALRLVENSDRFSSDMRALERGDTLNKDSLTGILHGFLGLLMIKVKSHISVGTPTDFCRDVASLVDEHGVSTIVFPWEARSTQPSTQLARMERLMQTSTQAQFVVALNCHTAALASATSSGLSLLVPFFGGDDDVAALLLALAIVERDSSAELVILSFLEPEKPPVVAEGGGEEGEGGGPVAENGSVMGRIFTSPRGEEPQQGSEPTAAPHEIGEKDIESVVLRGTPVVTTTTTTATTAPANAQSVQQKQNQPVPASPVQENASASTAPVHHRNSSKTIHPVDDSHHHRGTGSISGSVSASGASNGAHATGSGSAPGSTLLHRLRSSSSSPWSGRELVKMAEKLDRVNVTPAWSLNAALGAIAVSSAAPTPAPLAPLPDRVRDTTAGATAAATASAASAAASIVRQVTTAQSTGLVLCGCAGSGQPPMIVAAAAAGAAAGGGGGAAVGSGTPSRGRFAAPLAGVSSVHGKWPSLSRSRHGSGTSLSMMTRSWHGKSRHHYGGGGRSYAGGSRVSGAGGGGHPATQGAGMMMRPNSQRGGGGGLQSAIDGVVSDALGYLVGDVAAALFRSDKAPAVFAVRAGGTGNGV